MNCELEDITVHYQVFGDGKPIIMLHGWSSDHRPLVREMEPVFRQRGGWKRIYLDLPGHGNTPGKEWITNQDKMLDVVLDFIDHLVPGQHVVVAGVSAGAYLARGIAYRRSKSMDGLLLIVPVIAAEDVKRHLPARVTLVADASASDLEPDEANVILNAVVQSQTVVDTLRANFSASKKSGDRAFQAKIREHPERYAFSFDVDALAQPFPAPTLLLTGRQDSGVGYRDAWDILENYPRGTFVVLDRAGHFLTLEQKDLFQALMGEWLDRVEEYAGVSG